MQFDCLKFIERRRAISFLIYRGGGEIFAHTIMKRFLNSIMLCLLCFVPLFSETLTDPVMLVYADDIIDANIGDDGITISGGHFPSMVNPDNPADLVAQPLNKYKSIATIVTGFATVTAFLAMIFSMTKLSTAGDNEMERKKAIMGILTSGIGVALLGSATIIIAFFWNLFK